MVTWSTWGTLRRPQGWQNGLVSGSEASAGIITPGYKGLVSYGLLIVWTVEYGLELRVDLASVECVSPWHPTNTNNGTQ